MISSMANKIRDRLQEFCSIVTFVYKGVDCDVDPFSPTEFHMRFGDKEDDFDSIDRVMNEPFFAGCSLTQIADKITDVDLG